MYSIKCSNLDSFLENPDFELLKDSNEFCFRCLKNKNEKCILFYRSLFCNNTALDGFIKCPFGFNCYVPRDNCQAVLSSIVSEKSDLKKIKYRNKIHGYRNEEITSSSEIKKLFDRYNEYLFYASIGNNICHDLNNALNYLIVLTEKLQEEQDKEIISYYNQIIKHVSIIQEKATFDTFDFKKTYNSEELLNDFVSLQKTLDKLFKTCEKSLKSIDPDNEPNRYCVYAGISLLRTLLRRSLVFANVSLSNDKDSKPFSIHQMVKKISLLLKYKASNKNVIIAPFYGSPQHKVIGQSDDIFTVIFTLIDNAIKYSHPYENIYISFREDNKLMLSIVNTSDFLSSYDLEHIHDKFYRGKNKSLKGQGLGLYIVKMICENNNVEYNASYEDGRFVYRLVFCNLQE